MPLIEFHKLGLNVKYLLIFFFCFIVQILDFTNPGSEYSLDSFLAISTSYKIGSSKYKVLLFCLLSIWICPHDESVWEKTQNTPSP